MYLFNLFCSVFGLKNDTEQPLRGTCEECVYCSLIHHKLKCLHPVWKDDTTLALTCDYFTRTQYPNKHRSYYGQ